LPGEEGGTCELSRHAVVVVWPGDSGVVEVAVDVVVDGFAAAFMRLAALRRGCSPA